VAAAAAGDDDGNNRRGARSQDENGDGNSDAEQHHAPKRVRSVKKDQVAKPDPYV
jgi:hypothetical protein